MRVELEIFSPAWQNFCTAYTKAGRSLTLTSVNKLLAPWGGYVKDLGEWFVYFNSEEELTMFILRWA